MAGREDRALAALRELLRASHFTGADELPALVSAAGDDLGAEHAALYLADYDQVLLVPFTRAGNDQELPGPLPIESTLAGRTFSELAQHAADDHGRTTLWTPVLNGTERIGVLQLEFPAGSSLDEGVRDCCSDVAALVAELVMTRNLYGDAVQRVRRRSQLTVPAELQWSLLPPLTFVTPRVAVAAGLAPTDEVAGDSFDYAMNGDTLHVAIIDAMGHGMEATLLSAVAIATLRNARRRGEDLAATVRAMDAALEAQFGPARFVTGVVGQLDVATGWWSWITCGHPPALVVRDGHVVKTLDSVVEPPLGLRALGEELQVGSERLQPGDRLLLYTDGVIEARDEAGVFFGTERLVEFVSRQEADGRPAPETLRRLNLAILAHQDGVLQDDATTVLVEWRTDELVRTAV